MSNVTLTGIASAPRVLVMVMDTTLDVVLMSLGELVDTVRKMSVGHAAVHRRVPAAAAGARACICALTAELGSASFSLLAPSACCEQAMLMLGVCSVRVSASTLPRIAASAAYSISATLLLTLATAAVEVGGDVGSDVESVSSSGDARLAANVPATSITLRVKSSLGGTSLPSSPGAGCIVPVATWRMSSAAARVIWPVVPAVSAASAYAACPLTSVCAVARAPSADSDSAYSDGDTALPVDATVTISASASATSPVRRERCRRDSADCTSPVTALLLAVSSMAGSSATVDTPYASVTVTR
eukprot:PhM_4_TR16752/c1_g2_i2/m.26752